MNRKLQIVLSLVAIALLFSSFNAAAWQGETPLAPEAINTAFTYQGFLEDSAGNPITDTCDFVFKLYPQMFDGTQVGVDSEIIDVDVEEGLFTTRVNINNEFGTYAFYGDDRYLAVSVKCSQDAAYLSLGARQRLSAAPYASYALVAGKVDTQDPYILSLSPYSAMTIEPFTDYAIEPRANGGITIKKTGAVSGARAVLIPVSTISEMYGEAFTASSLRVCYAVEDATNGYITAVGVYTGDGQGTKVTLIESHTDRANTSHSCFEVQASNQDQLLSAYVQLTLYYTGVGTPDITIYEVGLELSH